MYPKLITIGDFFIPTYDGPTAIAFLLALWSLSNWGGRRVSTATASRTLGSTALSPEC